MKIRLDPSPLRDSRWSGHLLRFTIGGLVTMATGALAKVAGPELGGLFLALPAIFPAGMALIAKLQNDKVQGGARGDRGRRAAVIEATGAATGSVGLLVYALVAWAALSRGPLWAALGSATLAWALGAAAAWSFRKAPR